MEKNINIQGYSISYAEVNPSGKSTLLFIHGNSLSKDVFEQQLSSEAFSSYRLIALDLPGHGKTNQSKIPSEEYNVPFFAKLIAELITTLQLEKVVLIGHSLGGHIAIEIVEEFPHGIAGMAIVGTPPLGIPANVPSAFLPNPVAGLLFESDLSDAQMKEMATAIVKFDNKGTMLSAIQNSDPLVRSSIGASIVAGNYVDEIKALKHTAIPYVIFLGENDGFCNVDYFKKYNFTNQWKGELQIVPLGTHTPFMDNAEVVNKLLLEFLTKNAF
jgi:pimeloyl-ACP methyl ester carboxylesterase